MDTTKRNDDHANRDPISGEPGAHPVGVGIGAAVGGVAGGAAAGAAAGTVAGGPIGTAIGAAVGAVVGGLGGKAVAEKVDPTVASGHEAYWREHHARQSYYDEGTTYDDYAPAYRLGSQPRDAYANKSFDEAEPHLAADYERMKGDSRIGWDRAKHAVRAAWDRVTDSDRRP